MSYQILRPLKRLECPLQFNCLPTLVELYAQNGCLHSLDLFFFSVSEVKNSSGWSWVRLQLPGAIKIEVFPRTQIARASICKIGRWRMAPCVRRQQHKAGARPSVLRIFSPTTWSRPADGINLMLTRNDHRKVFHWTCIPVSERLLRIFGSPSTTSTQYTTVQTVGHWILPLRWLSWTAIIP